MTVRLGVIGISEGNGHPYSWSAIFNGYDREAMNRCGFPVIPQYLSQHAFPEEAIQGANVTHVWTQSESETRNIAAAARIPYVAKAPTDMLGKIDGLLLARDDAESHLMFAAPYLAAGVPVYIDKPLALTLSAAEQLFALERYPGQIFSCSALRFAAEFQLAEAERTQLGTIRYVDASVPKNWDKYAIHAIDPALQIIGVTDRPARHRRVVTRDMVQVSAEYEAGPVLRVTSFGNVAAPISVRVIGDTGSADLVFKDTFHAFKGALEKFVAGIRTREMQISRASMLAAVAMVEAGHRIP